MAEAEKKFPWGTFWAAAGAIAAIITLLLALPSLVQGQNESSPAPITSAPQAPVESPAAPVVTSAPVAQPAVPVAEPVMQEILVDTIIATQALPCCQVGPGMFELDDRGETRLGYIWSSRMSDGTENDSDGCAMLITVTGPENPPAWRTTKCSVAGSNGFSGSKNIAYLSTVGDYTITVRDEVSGVSGVGHFAVVP